ncbi:uncharacterized protein LOC124255000 [Haliotis rubra]|uniref:uncharacterized protein LOC124255000 n=1 Tax=Haliotis rubra TaxID=36100 RepID=UPI001EE52DDD|nr:uncharacterized protein LOC124255000 [Haliotis rubra]XP_046544798.1 uncharacterized protein LOC124255000 [Haliotis rubra]
MLYTLVVIATLSNLTEGDPTLPENMTCVLYAKRLLTCTYDLRDDVDRNNTTCTTCSQFSKNDTCPDVVTGRMCNTAVGRCEYDCDRLKFCDGYHMMKISMKGDTDARAGSMCRQIKTKDYIQPGPVRDLQVRAINSTALQVSWKKPDDRYPYYETYKYVVLYSNRVKKTKSKDEDVEMVLTDLKPWTNYTVTVRSRPRRKGFLGPPLNATDSTFEDVPARGPVIPESAFSKVAPGVLEVYWGSVPREASRGIIVNYSVHASCCLSQPLYTTGHSTTINITGHSNVTVRVNAATRIGWSKNASQLHVYRRDLDVRYVHNVHRANKTLHWDLIAERKALNTTIVSWCFGYQHYKLPQLVKCMNAIQKKLLPGGRRSMAIKDLDPLRVRCSRCEWQYAVSRHVGNVRSKLVWNTPLRFAAVDDDKRDQGYRDILAVIIVLTVMVAVMFIAVGAISGRLYSRHSLCKRFVIITPRMVTFPGDEDSISMEHRIHQDAAGVLISIHDIHTDHREDKHITPDTISHLRQQHKHPSTVQDHADEIRGHGNSKIEVSLPGHHVLPEGEPSGPEAPWLPAGPQSDENSETWSCSSDSCMSTYRQVTTDSGVPGSQEDYSWIVSLKTVDECQQDASGTGTRSNGTRELISLSPVF